MRKNILTFAILAGLTLASTSCDDLVEVEPKNNLSGDVVLSGLTTYDAVLTSAYDRIQSFNYWGRDMALLGDALSDNIFTVTTQASGRYTGANRNAQGSHYNFWGTGYATVNELNTVIAKIDGLAVPATDADKKARIKAEALALRGMVFFDLARVYGYEPNQIQKGFNKSIILRTTPTLGANDAVVMNRSTVEETYEQIETDLLAAIATFPTTGTINVERINKPATHALLGKVYLYWGRWADAVTQFDLALASTPAVLSNTYAADFAKGTHPESLFEINFVQSTEMAGVLGVNDSPFSYTQPNGLNDERLSTYGGQTPSAELKALFGAGDDRAKLFFTRASSTSSGIEYVWADKYTSSKGAYTDDIKVIRYADVLLMKAEAKAELGNFGEAATILTTLRTARKATVDIVPTDASIKQFIQDERRRELYYEGHRFFDLKRRGQGITKPAATGVGTLAADDFKILAPIPNAEVLFNPELPQNPGY